MKIKTDIYTKIVLTVIAVALVGILVKDMNLVTKAHATEMPIDLSALNIEKTEDDEGITFFVYESSNLDKAYGGVQISSSDTPTYIITNKKQGRIYFE